MIPNPCIEVHTSALDRPSVPAWFAEVVIIAHHLATKGLLEAFARAGSAWYEDAALPSRGKPRLRAKCVKKMLLPNVLSTWPTRPIADAVLSESSV